VLGEFEEVDEFVVLHLLEEEGGVVAVGQLRDGYQAEEGDYALFWGEDIAQLLNIIPTNHLIAFLIKTLGNILQPHLTQILQLFDLQHRLLREVQPRLLEALSDGGGLEPGGKPELVLEVIVVFGVVEAAGEDQHGAPWRAGFAFHHQDLVVEKGCF